MPYGSTLYAADGEVVEKGKLIARWDPFNAVIITEATGKIEFEGVIENVTYKVESDESTGLREIIIIESKDKTKVPTAHIMTEDGELIRTYNLPVGGHVVVENGQKVKAGEVIVKIPRALVRRVISRVVFPVLPNCSRRVTRPILLWFPKLTVRSQWVR